MRRYLMDLWEWAVGVATGTHRFVWWFAGGGGNARYVVVYQYRPGDDELLADHRAMVAKMHDMGYAVVVCPPRLNRLTGGSARG